MQKLVGFFEARSTLQKSIYLAIASICLFPFVSAPVALTLGILIAQLIGNPFEIASKKITNTLLQVSVVGLGFGMNTDNALKVGKEGLLMTIFSIVSLLVLGFLLTKILKVEKITGYLISAGTAICGGSAIAAIAPLVKAGPIQTSIALAIVFTLNSIALLLFPAIGSFLELTQKEFGLWCAIAIHDTSSVVGAASRYGAEALEVATTIKLARALWIIPLSVVSLLLFNNTTSKIKIPWFIGFFLLAMQLNTSFSLVQSFSPIVVAVSTRFLALTLFLIGSGLTIKVIQSIGLKPLVLAIILWVFISCSSLLLILNEKY